MLRTVVSSLVLLFAFSAVAADLPLGDSSRGRALFETQQCTRCHSINGRGGKIAPDLGQRTGRNFTPVLLVSTLWNHAPAMWSEMRRQGIESPVITTQDAADLFAFFYSARYFDRRGDAARGKDAFSRHRCADCHSLAESKGDAPPAATWQALGSPVALAEGMWNHAKRMSDEFERRGLRFPKLSSQDLTDIYVYLRNHPSISPPQGSFAISPAEGGEVLIKEKGCLKCHRGALALTTRMQGKTINDLAAAMWNHGPRITDKAGTFEPGQMGTLLSYIWATQFFETSGDARRGQKVFRDKSCAGCHQDGRAPRLSGEFTTMRMIAALWNHGPAMLQQMRSRGISWPRFSDREMADLVSYLKANR